MFCACLWHIAPTDLQKSHFAYLDEKRPRSWPMVAVILNVMYDQLSPHKWSRCSVSNKRLVISIKYRLMLLIPTPVGSTNIVEPLLIADPIISATLVAIGRKFDLQTRQQANLHNSSSKQLEQATKTCYIKTCTACTFLIFVVYIFDSLDSRG